MTVLTPLAPIERPIGIFRNVPADVYHRRALDIVNCGGLKVLIEDTPRHYHHFIHSDDEDIELSDALAFGQALHCAILEPEVFAGSYRFLPKNAPKDLRRFRDADKPSQATLDSIAWWDAWEAETAGELRSLELEDNGFVIAAGELIDECEKEVTIYWIDEETGLYCKARADLWAEELSFGGDLKSCLRASKEAFGRVIFQRFYHVQAAHYCEGFRALGKPLEKFTFFPMEKRAPNVCASYDCTPADWERGFTLRQRAMRTLRRCLDTNTWPGFTRRVEPCPMPAFAHYDANDKD
jgi:hypothetical protein